MKKTSIIKKGIFVLGATLAFSAVSPNLFSSQLAGLAPVQAEAVATISENAVEVSTIAEFQAALLDANVTDISVVKSIKFTKNITNIPNRDVKIHGNSDKGVVITSGIYSIYGKQNKNGKNTVSIYDATIEGDATTGRFFTGGSGNGPSSYGWDVYSEGVNYTGARFVHLSEGKLTFGGKNNINTRAENAWVHELEFLPNSEYTGVAANKDHGQFSAFYFNGALVNGKATGTVDIGKNAKVNVKIGPQSTVNYYYPVFYDKVDTVNVADGATLDVDAAGVAFQFIPRADYKSGNPSLNVGSGSTVKFNGRGGGNYATMKLQYYGTEVNVGEGSFFQVTGNSTKGLIESEYKGAVINLDSVEEFYLQNDAVDSPLFYGTNTTLNGTNLSEIQAWSSVRFGPEYSERAASTFSTSDFSVNFGKSTNSRTLSIDGDLSKQFRMENYGKLSITGGSW